MPKGKPSKREREFAQVISCVERMAAAFEKRNDLLAELLELRRAKEERCRRKAEAEKDKAAGRKRRL